MRYLGLLLWAGLLWGLGGISGQVIDESTGAPLDDAVIQVFPAGHHGPPAASVTTDSLGQYVIDDLEPGAYFVRAWRHGYEPEWYDNAHDRHEADTVYVTEGQITPGIDFALEPWGWGGSEAVIQGTVVDELTGAPLAHAWVMVRGQGGGHHGHAWTLTDRAGAYTLHVQAGTYLVMAFTWGYAPEWYEEASTPMEATPITLEAGDTLTGIDFTLLPWNAEGGVVMGVVTDQETGEPIPGAHVRAFATSHGHHPRWMHARTDSLGQYTLFLPPGDYYLMARAHGYFPEFYPESPNFEGAQPVTVEVGDTLTGIDFTLTAFSDSGATVAGFVYNETDSTPIPEASVIGFLPGLPGWGHVRHALTDSVGGYLLTGLPEGAETYVAAWAPGYQFEFYEDAATFPEATPVYPPATGVDFYLAPVDTGAPGAISGHVSFEGGPAGFALITVHELTSGEVVARTMANPAGGFTAVSLLPGQYYVEAAYPGIAEGTSEPIQVEGGEVTGVVIALDPVAAKETPGNPLVPALFAAPREKGWGVVSFSLRSEAQVRLELYDVTGRRVASIFSGALPAGSHAFSFRAPRTGVYFVRLSVDGARLTRKVLLLR